MQLAFVLFAFYLIAHATADAGAAVTALIFDSRARNPEGRVVGSSVLVVAGLILLRRSSPRLKELSAPRARGGEE